MSATLKRIGRLFRHPQWNVGIVDISIDKFLTSETLPDVRWLNNPDRSYFLADPFPICRGGQLTSILAEYYDYRSGKGSIVAIDAFGRGASTKKADVVIKLPVHLSYPYVVQHEDDLFCIPETHQNNEIALYRAAQSHHRWQKIATLVPDFAGLDATVFKHEGRWWLLCTDNKTGRDTELLGWHAPHLLGPWTPHHANPLKVDIRSSRPAGTPFVHDGQLYRPAQDCSATYGGSIVLNRVARLTPDTFAEEPVKRIVPDARGPYPRGIHTISAAGGKVLVDGKREVFIPRLLVRQLAAARRRLS